MSFELAAWIVGVLSVLIILAFTFSVIAYYVRTVPQLQLPGHWFLVAIDWLTGGDVKLAYEHVRRFRYQGVHHLVEATA